MRWWSSCSIVLLFMVSGCKPADPIRSYTVPKETGATSNTPTEGQAYRFLGAVLPIDEKYSFFVKFVGPSAVISAEVKAFDDFLGSISPVTNSNDKPKYTIPEGWTVADKPNRIVTLTRGKAEMYLSGPFGGNLLENINRWRKEIGLRELRSDELPDAVKKIPYGKGSGYRMDESGPVWNQGRPMMGK